MVRLHDRLTEMSGEPFRLGAFARRTARRIVGRVRTATAATHDGPIAWPEARKHYHPHANAILLDPVVRAAVPQYREIVDQWLPTRPSADHPPRILFLLNVLNSAGGVLSVTQLVDDLVALGADARLAVRSPAGFEPEIPLNTPPLFFRDASSLIDFLGKGNDVVVGTLWSTMYYVMEAFRRYRSFTPAYFVQDYEPLFLPESHPELRRFAEATYRFTPFCFAKTDWICDRVREVGGKITLVPPGLDLDRFKPQNNPPNGDKKIILAMVRPHTPRRGAATAIAVLSAIAQRRNDVAIHLFGVSDQEFAALDPAFPCTNHGPVSNADLPALYSQAYLYADFSEFHGFGRTIAEAMACGIPCVTTESGGISAFVQNEKNALTAPVNDAAALITGIETLLDDPALHATLAAECRESVLPFDRTHSARETLAFLTRCLPR